MPPRVALYVVLAVMVAAGVLVGVAIAYSIWGPR